MNLTKSCVGLLLLGFLFSPACKHKDSESTLRWKTSPIPWKQGVWDQFYKMTSYSKKGAWLAQNVKGIGDESGYYLVKCQVFFMKRPTTWDKFEEIIRWASTVPSCRSPDVYKTVFENKNNKEANLVHLFVAQIALAERTGEWKKELWDQFYKMTSYSKKGAWLAQNVKGIGDESGYYLVKCQVFFMKRPTTWAKFEEIIRWASTVPSCRSPDVYKNVFENSHNRERNQLYLFN